MSGLLMGWGLVVDCFVFAGILVGLNGQRVLIGQFITDGLIGYPLDDRSRSGILQTLIGTTVMVSPIGLYAVVVSTPLTVDGLYGLIHTSYVLRYVFS